MKKKTLNELRQVKDTVYKPRLDLAKQYSNSKTIDELIERYPNDTELSREVRKLKNKGR